MIVYENLCHCMIKVCKPIWYGNEMIEIIVFYASFVHIV